MLELITIKDGVKLVGAATVGGGAWFSSTPHERAR